MLVKLGLKDSGLMGGGPQGGFIAKDKEGIRSRLISFLQKKQFIAMHISSMVDSARNVQKSFLKEIFKEAHVDVVSQESDQEILNILKPRAHGTGIIIYKIRKPD
jgi:hypothetical protein